eukprot:4819968-Karenia_brevis.AAC.1
MPPCAECLANFVETVDPVEFVVWRFNRQTLTWYSLVVPVPRLCWQCYVQTYWFKHRVQKGGG